MDFDSPPHDPVAVCQTWLDEARAQCQVPNTHAMALATVDDRGQPSCRMVLLKGFDERGAVFFTNRQSQKGVELDASPRAALLFFWDELSRQIRIEGSIEVVSDEEADAYFASRPRGSQLGAWASDQSRSCADRDTMEARLKEVESTYDGQEIPRPPHWIGYRVRLEMIEFWQGGEDRMHDRIVYSANGDGTWQIQRLWP
ncbi:MAG: pyridoxamine 5'-phosphate oxidase [Planctomycetota bacterium]|nr:pyridoxamine 5'-phosphate oxidase [Planctomycetota bacterium]